MVAGFLGFVLYAVLLVGVLRERRYLEPEVRGSVRVPAREIFATPRHAYTRHLLAAEPGGAPEPPRPSAATIMEGHDVRVWFPIKRGLLRRTVDHVKAVDGVTFQIHGNQTFGLVGESGSGKSTLARAVLRLYEPTGGRVVFDGRDVGALSSRELRALRRQMQIVFQDPLASLNPMMSAGAIVGDALKIHRVGTKREREEEVGRLLDLVGVGRRLADTFPHEFSGGQQQRVAIARALALKPQFVICDEPVSSLDLSIQAQILNLLETLQERFGLAYLFISHDLKVVEHLSDVVGVM